MNQPNDKHGAPTPRTDAACSYAYEYDRGHLVVSREFARQLERELAEEKEYAAYEASRADGAIREMVEQDAARFGPLVIGGPKPSFASLGEAEGIDKAFGFPSMTAPEAARQLHQEAQSFLHPMAMGLPEVKEFAHKVRRYLEATALSATKPSIPVLPETASKAECDSMIKQLHAEIRRVDWIRDGRPRT
jgi:hypothetical protein